MPKHTFTSFRGGTRLTLTGGTVLEVREDGSEVLDALYNAAEPTVTSPKADLDLSAYVTREDFANFGYVTAKGVRELIDGLELERGASIELPAGFDFANLATTAQLAEIEKRIVAIQEAEVAADPALAERLTALEELVAGPATPATDDKKGAGKA